jgi:hypothetical protein
MQKEVIENNGVQLAGSLSDVDWQKLLAARL